MANAVMPGAHQDEDPDFNAKAPSYKTASFTDEAHAFTQGLPRAPVRVVFAYMAHNAFYEEDEPLFAVYETMDDVSFVGHFFARALQEFGL
ncbi:MAG: hypothetical protein WKG03_16715 [Telluria sp.]